MERIKNKNIKTSIFRVQDNNSIMCGYFCILFIEYMLKGKTLTDFTNLFSPWDTKYSSEDQSNYGLNEISKIKDYFNDEVQYQQFLTNKLRKYLTIFDYSNKILTVVLTVFSGINIFSNVKNKQLLGLITFMFSLLFSLSFGIIIKLQQETKLRKKNIINYCI